MNVSAFIPGVGLDRNQRAHGPAAATAEPPSLDAAEPVVQNTAKVAGADGTGAPGQPGSGFGDGARENLFRSEAGPTGKDPEFSEAEQDQIRKLKARDAEVRRHEEAHARVGGQYAGQPSYTYQTGPDGKRYAIGGEVSIDVAPVPDDPQATIVKMDIVIAAALAPAEPSGQDRKVASQAARQRLEATADLAEDRAEQVNGSDQSKPDLPGAVQKIDAAGYMPDLNRAA